MISWSSGEDFWIETGAVAADLLQHRRPPGLISLIRKRRSLPTSSGWICSKVAGVFQHPVGVHPRLVGKGAAAHVRLPRLRRMLATSAMLRAVCGEPGQLSPPGCRDSPA